MSRIKYDDYKTTDGHTDWRAVEKARLANGEICRTCNSYIVSLNDPKGYPVECRDCQTAHESDSEINHDHFIRCPACGNLQDPSDGGDNYKCYEDGDHDATCDECGYGYEFVTRVSYSFDSPERVNAAEVAE